MIEGWQVMMLIFLPLLPMIALLFKDGDKK